MWVGIAIVACAEDVHLVNGRAPGGASVDLWLRDGRLVEPLAGPVREKDLRGAWVVPAVIDSHVHLSYLPVGPELADHGVVAAVDLASPESAVAASIPRGPRVRWSGPMITAVRGYPTTSWGSAGYGLECATADQAEAAVRRLASEGAKVVKVPIQDPQLPDDVLKRAIDTAHALGLPVAVHALTDATAARGAAFGADILAHTPVEPLSASTVAAWSGRTVISTIVAFGGSPDAIANLRALRAAGAKILYGTDLGNSQTVGVDPAELQALVSAGLDGAAILAATTADPAKTWGWDDLGALTPGHAASFLVLDRDPLKDPLTLASPREVWIDGIRR
jgi:imidazolonepropionase-like amidohydrolase